MPAKHERTYKHLDADAKADVEAALSPEEPPARTVESLEAEHYAHKVLHDRAEADGDEEAAEAAKQAMQTIKDAITEAEKAEPA